VEGKKMKKLILIALLLMSMVNICNATTTVLNFDDLGGTLPTNYGGLTWDSSWKVWDSQGNTYYPPDSNPNVLYTHSQSATVSFGQDVTFLGSYVAAVNVNQQIYWEGLSGGVVKYSSSPVLGGFTGFESLNWSGVDQVKYVTIGDPDYSVIDDFTYSTDTSAPVPEPGTMALLGLGMAGLAVYGKRRQKKA
jgi:hypothetical protein